MSDNMITSVDSTDLLPDFECMGTLLGGGDFTTIGEELTGSMSKGLRWMEASELSSPLGAMTPSMCIAMEWLASQAPDLEVPLTAMETAAKQMKAVARPDDGAPAAAFRSAVFEIGSKVKTAAKRVFRGFAATLYGNAVLISTSAEGLPDDPVQQVALWTLWRAAVITGRLLPGGLPVASLLTLWTFASRERRTLLRLQGAQSAALWDRIAAGPRKYSHLTTAHDLRSSFDLPGVGASGSASGSESTASSREV